MKAKTNHTLTRRGFIKTSATAAIGLGMVPALGAWKPKPGLMTRDLGRLNHAVTTFGLGGQASIQWTPDGVDPVAIILKAFDKNINYFDTSNLYGPSQLNYGRAFQHLQLIPGRSGYNESLRRSIFLTTKTHIRFAKGDLNAEGINNWTNGPAGSHTLDDVRRSLSQLFGDGQGTYPEGAYLDMVLLHDISGKADVEAVYEGLYNTDPKAERIGALAALRDLRDGTNLTGLNPGEEKLIRHVGFSGHYDAGVMIELIRRDRDNLLEGMLVAVNANDKLNFNMQHNVIPVAQAKNMGIIGMKVFADGAMYTKGAHWSGKTADVVRKVGGEAISFSSLIGYTLTTPGISTAIIGIGQISDNPEACQLTQNIRASQVKPDDLSETDRAEIEKNAGRIKEGKTNYFQRDKGGLTPVSNIRFTRKDHQRILITWDTAYAGGTAIDRYEVWKNNVKTGVVKHTPQTSLKPFEFEDTLLSPGKNEYTILTMDKNGDMAVSEKISVL